MNAYSQLLNYIKSLGDADPFVNTSTQGSYDKLDLDKGNIFPILHTTITGGNFTNGSTIIFNIEIACLQQRDVNAELSTDKFYGQSNEIDNMNETLAVLNRLWLKMYQDFADNNITSSENPTLDIIEDKTTANNIEGWNLVFEVEVPNTTINICQTF